VLRRIAGRDDGFSATVLDSRTLRFTPLGGARVGWVGRKRGKVSKLAMAVDALGHLSAAHVTPMAADDPAEVDYG
jgi:hypothetical protein